MVCNKSFSEYKYSKIPKDAESDVISDCRRMDQQDRGYFLVRSRVIVIYDFYARSDTPDD